MDRVTPGISRRQFTRLFPIALTISGILVALLVLFQANVNRFFLTRTIGGAPRYGYVQWEGDFTVLDGEPRHVLVFHKWPPNTSWSVPGRFPKCIVLTDRLYHELAVYKLDDFERLIHFHSASIESSDSGTILALSCTNGTGGVTTRTFALAGDQIVRIGNDQHVAGTLQ